MLAHRIGLIPLRADARLFVEKNSADTREREDDTLVFKLQVACKKNPKAVEGNENPKNLYIDSNGRRINLWRINFIFRLYSLYGTYGMGTYWKSSNESWFSFWKD